MSQYVRVLGVPEITFLPRVFANARSLCTQMTSITSTEVPPNTREPIQHDIRFTFIPNFNIEMRDGNS